MNNEDAKYLEDRHHVRLVGRIGGDMTERDSMQGELSMEDIDKSLANKAYWIMDIHWTVAPRPSSFVFLPNNGSLSEYEREGPKSELFRLTMDKHFQEMKRQTDELMEKQLWSDKREDGLKWTTDKNFR